MKTPIAYFKRIQGRRGKEELIVTICKVVEDGRIYTINLNDMKTSTIQTFGSTPLKLIRSNKRAWDNAYKKLKKHLS